MYKDITPGVRVSGDKREQTFPKTLRKRESKKKVRNEKEHVK
jgi:hypothetical protein